MHTIEFHGEVRASGLAWTSVPMPTPVASALQGVWRRTLLETASGRDTRSGVRWVQTGRCQGSLSDPQDSAPVCLGPGAEHSVFQTPERIVQTRLDPRELAVWERLPGSQGPRIALARRDGQDRPTEDCLLLCGGFLLHTCPEPDGTRRFAFGQLDAARARWTVERASDTRLLGRTRPWMLQRLGLDLARFAGSGELDGAWEVLEWADA